MTTPLTRRQRDSEAALLRVVPRARRRNRPLAGLAVLLILGFGLATAVVVLQAGDREPVLVVARKVEAGRAIQDADLREASVAAGGVATVPASSRASVVGRIAAVPLLPGTLLAPSQLGSGPALEPGTVVVGLSLKGGQLPTSSLRAGDPVMVVATPPAGASAAAGAARAEATVIVGEARVFSVERQSSGDGSTLVSLVVTEADASAVAAATAAGQASVVLRAAS